MILKNKSFEKKRVLKILELLILHETFLKKYFFKKTNKLLLKVIFQIFIKIFTNYFNKKKSNNIVFSNQTFLIYDYYKYITFKYNYKLFKNIIYLKKKYFIYYNFINFIFFFKYHLLLNNNKIEIFFIKNSLLNKNTTLLWFLNNSILHNLNNNFKFYYNYINYNKVICNINVVKTKRNFFISAYDNKTKTNIFKFSSGIIKNSKYKRSKRGKYSECDHTIRIFASFLRKKLKNLNITNFNIFSKKKSNINLKKLLNTLSYKLNNIKNDFKQTNINNITTLTRKKFGLSRLKRPKRKRKRHFKFNNKFR